MHYPEALILRRCYPVPVTFADLRSAANVFRTCHLRTFLQRQRMLTTWTAALKEATGALDEVYAVVDGREVRVAITDGECVQWISMDPEHEHATGVYRDLLDAADRDGYWARPHEVRITLQERPVSHGEVARAVLVGQEYAERGGAQ